MKLLSLIIFAFFISLLGVAQQPTYLRIFSGNSYDEGIAAFRLPNKEIRLIGNTGSYGHGSTDVWFIALDSNGNFLWHKFYSSPDVEKVSAAVMTPQGDIYMVGSTTQNASKSYQLYFLGLDQYGQVLVSQNYGGSNWDFGFGICQTSDSTFALVGETFSKGAGQGDLYVLKVNKQGDTLWTKTYGGVQEDLGNEIKLMPDRGFIVVGATKSFGNGSLDSYLLRLDVNGDSVWTSVAKHISDAEYLSVAVNPDSSFICSGYQSDSMNTYRDVNMVRYDQDANQLWSAAAHLSEGEDAYARSIFREDNGEFTYCGITTKYSPTTDPSARITRITSSGWWNESSTIGDYNEDIGYFVSPDSLNGKSYFLVGTTKNYGVNRSGILFVRLDSNMDYDTTRIVETPTNMMGNKSFENVKVYPNPVTDYLYIRIPANKADIDISIYDALGRLIIKKDYDTHGTEFYLSVKKLSPGIYYLLINNGTTIFHMSFLKTALQ